MKFKSIQTVIAAILTIIVIAFLLITYQQKTIQSTDSPTKDNTNKLKVGILSTASNVQLFAAQQQGYFQDEGLDVEATTFSGGSTIANAVASGDLQIGWSSLAPIIVAHDKGFDFQFISAGAYKRSDGKDTQQFLVSSSSVIQTPKDLEGKKFAVNSIDNQLMKLGLKKWTEKNGVDLDKITLVELPFSQMEPALKNKQVDAGNFVEPFLTAALENETGRVLDSDPFGPVAESFLFSAWFGSKSWIDENPKIVQAFQNAIEKATIYIENNPQEIPKLIAQNIKMDEETAAKIIQPIFGAQIKKGDTQVIIDFFKEFGYISKGFSEQEIISSPL